MVDVDFFFDGASRGNPGKSGAGCYLHFSDDRDKELYEALGIATNNQAEYQSIILGLQYLLHEYNNLNSIKTVNIKGDSQLVIKQLQGLWRVKSANIRTPFTTASNMIKEIKSRGIVVTMEHIPRAKNAHADRLANRGADQN